MVYSVNAKIMRRIINEIFPKNLFTHKFELKIEINAIRNNAPSLKAKTMINDDK